MKPLARLFLAFWLVASGGIGAPAPCVADDDTITNVVSLRIDPQVRTGVVRLSDLFAGVPPAADRDIAQAPSHNKPAIYGASVLAKLAERYGLNWHSESVTDHVTVTSIATRITEDMIRKAIAQKVKDAGTKGDIDVGFDNKAIEISLPADQTPDFTLNNFDYDPTSKRFRTELITENGQTPLTVPLAGRILIKLRVPILVRRLEGGTVIGISDIDWISVPDERVGETVITDATDLIGHELRHSAMEGELLHTNDIMPPRLVMRGGLVTLKIATPFMMLTAQGKALQDGVRGETVRVTNTQSNRMLEGTVEGPGIVSIPTAQKLAEAQ